MYSGLDSLRRSHVRASVTTKKLRQSALTVPHYVREIRDCRSARDVRDWLYYKVPGAFRLRSSPVALSLEITNDCNFGCPHCPRSELNLERDISYMSIETFRKIAEDAAGSTPLVKVFGLGEPALHPELDTMMCILRDLGFKADVYTNGTLFERWSDEQVLSWRLSTLVVSIDGVDERSFTRLRVGGDWSTLHSNVSRFRRLRDQQGRRPTIQVRHVIMPNETNAELKTSARHWKEVGADTVRYNYLVLPYHKRRPAADQQHRPRCRDIARDMHIRADGRVPLCGYDGHRTWIGDLRASSIQQVWMSDTVEAVRAAHAEGDLSRLPACQTCQFR